MRAQDTPAPAPLQEVTVTARKVQESVINVPMSISVLSAKTLNDYGIRDFVDYATRIPNLSFAYGGATSGNAGLGFSTSRGTAIRGVSGLNTTGFYIDDTPVFDSMDPRIVDIDRIEVLKGPQGTLYGSGSMGGNIRIITRKPSTSEDGFRYALLGGYTHGGSFDDGMEAAGNVVLSPGLLGVRVMGFYSFDSPFLTRRYPVPSAPGTFAERPDGKDGADGASLALLVTPVERLEVTLRMLYQRQYTGGWPAPFAPLPAFAVVSDTLNRLVDAQEASTDRWTLPSLDLDYHGQGWGIVSSTSYFERYTYDREDGTEGTTYAYEQAGFTPLPGVPLYWEGYTHTTRLAHETRLSVEETHRLRGIAGVYYADRHQLIHDPPQNTPGLAAAGAWPDDNGYSADTINPTRETAVFGELYWHALDPLTLTIGARTYWLREQSSTTADGFFQGGLFVQPLTTSKEHGTSPKFALDYHFAERTMGYALASRGFRPGGINLALPDACIPELSALGLNQQSALSYKSDSVWNYELGMKSELAPGGVLMSGSLFQINWQQIQQGIYLPVCGFSILGNSGAARNRGAEFELTGRVAGALTAHVSAGYLDAV
ncbi:MAG: TonB-dependent receptor, partial [Gammaproteobacteria bacterium]|nr:TonB-dependent receptor [Gammaproteobacteria bacterium]